MGKVLQFPVRNAAGAFDDASSGDLKTLLEYERLRDATNALNCALTEIRQQLVLERSTLMDETPLRNK